MALPGVLLVRLRALCNLSKCGHTGGKTTSNRTRDMRWYRTKAQNFHEHNAPLFQNKQDGNLLKEFPDPKNLLNGTISRSLGVNDLSQFIQYSCTEHAGVKKATLTLQWPCQFEENGYASKKADAERFAAAAACFRLKEMGLIGPNNQLPKRRAGRGRGGLHSHLYDEEENGWIDDVSRASHCSSPIDVSGVAEALSLFPQPKSLLTRVIQLATSSSRVREFLHFKTVGGKLKKCELTLLWPEEMTFAATATSRAAAEKKAAALACMKLRELQLLDKDNNPLTHAKYHREKVKEAGERERRPLPLVIPEYLEQRMKEYLTQYPVATEVQKLWEEEEATGQQVNQQCEEEEEEEDYEADPAHLIREAPSLDEMARLITVEEISPTSGLVSILKKRSVRLETLSTSVSSELLPENPTAKRRVRFRVPDDGYENDVGSGDSCLLLFLLCLVTVVISIGGTALYCAFGDAQSSVCQDFSRNVDFYVIQMHRGIAQLQHWLVSDS
uniref:DEAH (Asp-Glu-Ala-His) box polypeptide 30 n=1 Tax=Nothobranchius kuhntae TaxID=321403 RepID=A0A1A8JQI5_NOTKU